MTNEPTGTAIDARLGRREFMAAGAAAAVAACLPLAAGVDPSPVTAAVRRELLADWHIDDQWGPRYSEPIGFARPAAARELVAGVDPVVAAYAV
jgi:hypothetical protein